LLVTVIPLAGKAMAQVFLVELNKVATTGVVVS